MLDNALIGIFDEEDNLIFKDYTKKGKISLENLPYGKYYAKEIEAPKGYELNEEKYYFEINKENLEKEIEINNDLIIEVPKTGKNNLYYLSLIPLIGYLGIVRKIS